MIICLENNKIEQTCVQVDMVSAIFSGPTVGGTPCQDRPDRRRVCARLAVVLQRALCTGVFAAGSLHRGLCRGVFTAGSLPRGL
jgi:hypothetical protein